MKHCDHCGNELIGKEKFCPHCGCAVEEGNIQGQLEEIEGLTDNEPQLDRKKSYKKIFALATVAVLLLAFILLKNFLSPSVTSITLSETVLDLNYGDSVSVDYKIAPEEAEDAKVVWSSSDESVATVDEEGKITAVGEGACTITATAQNVVASLSVNVMRLKPEEEAAVGRWKSRTAIIHGEPSYGGAQVTLVLTSDLTGRMSVGEANIDFEWEYVMTDDEDFVYNCNASDSVQFIFTYSIEDGEENVIVMLDRENAFLFLRYS